jgi:D-aminopeptidase
MSKLRLRQLGIAIGRLPPGPGNAITDVPDVWVGHTTLIGDTPRVARTGVTVIVPRAGEILDDHAFAGFFSLNGFGEMTGTLAIDEFGLLTSPIALTNTNQVGVVHEALVAYAAEHFGRGYKLPVVAETHDGWLNDVNAFHVKPEHVFQALESAKGGHVAEGNVGGGTGMICHEFKGGIGTASRVVSAAGGNYTLGALVQANYGDRGTLRVDGVPVGRELGTDQIPSPWAKPPWGGSIIVILATDAPLLGEQCRRLAKRATIGLARVGGLGLDTSGDLFLAFATGNHYRGEPKEPRPMELFPFGETDALFEAAAEAVEEAIVNALVAAETMTGFEGHIAHALPHDALRDVMAKYRPI